MKLRFLAIFIVIFALFLAACAGKGGLPSPRDTERIITHSVGYGETWESIAEDFYSRADRAEALAAYNGLDVKDALKPGTAIRIPLTSRDLRSLGSRLDAASSYNHGLDLASQGNYAKAVEEFQRALEIDPLFSDAAFNLAVTYQKLGLHRNAITVLEGLTARHPENAHYLFALGNSQFHSGELRSARNSFEDALSVDPGHDKSLFSLAVVYEKTGNVQKAIKRWREYLERFPDSERADSARSRLESLLEISER